MIDSLPLSIENDGMTDTKSTKAGERSIIGFFVAAAERKGAKGVRECVDKGDEFVNWESRRNYRIEYIGENEDTLSIYHNGSWGFDSKEQSVEGKLPPVHSKTWVRKLINSGVDYPFAMSEWANYDGFARGERDQP